MAKVIVPLADGCEELEAVTVIDLLRRAQIEVVVAGLKPGSVQGSRGVVLLPDLTLDEALAQEYDMIVLPGGAQGANNLDQDPRIHRLLRQMFEDGCYIAAICAAPKVLANAGLLNERKATSFPEAIDPEQIPGLQYIERPVVIDGRIITSRGPGTAIDFALELITLLTDGQRRQEVESRLQRPGWLAGVS
jgi:4-methyl-5(b-hydroxyethyl)-thiazole monophosphate biosynthesis